MAKNKKDLFKNTLSAKSKAKPSDEHIEKITTEITDEPQQEKGFHIKFPMDDYNKLNGVSKKTRIPKKYIIINALNEYYEKHGH